MKRGRVFPLLVFIVMSATAFGVEIAPTNILTSAPEGKFSFDFIISGSLSTEAAAVKLTLLGSPTLTADSTASALIESDTGYWLYNNSAGVDELDNGSGSFTFSDGPDDIPPVPLIQTNDKIARFAFGNWDGTTQDYTFTLVTSNIASYILLGDFFSKETFNMSGGETSFNIHVPEPMTMVLLGLGGIFTLRRRGK